MPSKCNLVFWIIFFISWSLHENPQETLWDDFESNKNRLCRDVGHSEEKKEREIGNEIQ